MDSEGQLLTPPLFEAESTIDVGFLGVKVLTRNFEQNYVTSLRLAEIERRILRIEKALKITGFDISSIPFDN